MSSPGEFASGKKGPLALMPPASTLECPAGQTAVLVSVTYTDVQISEPNAGTESIPGTFSKVYFAI